MKWLIRRAVFNMELQCRRWLHAPFSTWKIMLGQDVVRWLASPHRAARAGDLRAGVDELIEFIRDVGAGKIGEPIVRRNNIHVVLTARDGEEYILKIAVTAYLAEPPRCTFVDRGFRQAPEAWPYPHPKGPFRSPSFICTPPTAEFYAHHRHRVYRHGEGSLVNTVATVFAALHSPQYVGRLTPGAL